MNISPKCWLSIGCGILLGLLPAAAAPGAIRWRAAVDGQFIGVSPAQGSDGTVYLGTPTITAGFAGSWGNVYAVNGATGATKWSFRLAAGLVDAMALGSNGYLYAPTTDGHLVALDSATGEPQWTFACAIKSAPALGPDGTVYLSAGYSPEIIYAVDGTTGVKRWQFLADGYAYDPNSAPSVLYSVMSSPAVGSDGTVYVGAYVGKVYALDGATGARKWEFPTGGPVRSSPAIGADGTVYVGSTDRNVYALDGVTGRPRWAFATGGQVISSPAIDREGTVYVGSCDHRIYALEGTTGIQKWVFTTGDDVTSSPVLAADGTLYASSRDGYFYALDAATGGLKWDLPLPAGGSSASIGTDGTIYVREYALTGTAGLADAPWPKFHQGGENQGSVSIPGAARIVRPPGGGPVAAGDPVCLTVVAGGTPPLSYQWYRGDQPLTNGNRADYQIAAFGPGDMGGYSVLVTNTAGRERSAPASLSAGYRLKTTTEGRGRVVVSPAADAYAPGTQVELTAIPEGMRRLLGWYGDLSGTKVQLTLTMDRDRAVEARFEFLPGDPRWQWAANAESAYGGPALGANGWIYFGSKDQHLYAVETQSGQVMWTFHMGGAAAGAPALGADGTVYAASGDNTLHALDSTTGAVKWEVALEGAVVASPAVAGDGTVYAVAGSWLHALDGTTGARKWRVNINGVAYGASPVVGRAGTVYVGSPDSKVYALNGATGATNWTFDTGAGVMWSPAIGADGTVYVGSYNRQFYALDGASGARQWSRSTVSPGELWQSAVLGWDNTVYLSSNDGQVYALDMTSGAQKWAYLRPGQGFTAPALAADGTVYVGGTRVVALDGATGTEKWVSAPGDATGTSLTIGPDGTIFVITTSGKVQAITGTAPLAGTAWPKDHGDLANSGRAPAVLNTPPSVVRQPTGGLIEPGPDAAVSVIAQGAPAPAYQWYFQGQPLPQGRSAVLPLPDLGTTRAGDYYVTVSNAWGTATSATVRVEPGYALSVGASGPGTVTRQPEAELYPAGTPVSLLAVPEPGRRFLGWSGDASGTDNPILVTLDRPRRLLARFKVLPGEKRWVFTAGAAVGFSPALGEDGTVFIGSDDGTLYALDGATGVRKWATTPFTAYTSPALGRNGMVYVGSMQPNLYALDAATGAKRWAFFAGDLIMASPAISLDGTVYVATVAGMLYAVDGGTGAKQWEFSVGYSYQTNSPAIGEDGTVYWATQNPPTIYAFDGATGAKKWQTATQRNIGSSPILGATGVLYLGLNGYLDWSTGFVYAGVSAYDGTTGAAKGGFMLHSAVQAAAPALGQDGTLYLGLRSSLYDPDAFGIGMLIPVSIQNSLYALDPTALTQKWAFATGQLVNGAPAAAADGTVYLGSGDGRLYALDGAHGTLKWSLRTGGPIRSSPTIGPDGTVYVGSDDGNVYAVAGSAPLAASPWPNLRGGPENRGSIQQEGAPRILEEPRGVSVASGQSATLRVVAQGMEPLRYQWFQGASGDSNNPISGASLSVFTTPALTTTTAYWVRVTNPDGHADSQTATVPVLPAGAFPSVQGVVARDGAIQLRIQGPIGSRWRVEQSADLVTWSSGPEVVTLADGTAVWSLPAPPVASRFFRLVTAP